VDFELGMGGNCMFTTAKDHSISTGHLTRSICFKEKVVDEADPLDPMDDMGHQSDDMFDEMFDDVDMVTDE
jgi:hypothetical protein